MKIAVCLKQILDPELPPRAFEIDILQKRPKYEEHPLVINPFDENALEMALQIRDILLDCHITVLTLGTDLNEEILRKALALKVDTAVLVKSDETDLNSFRTAQYLGESLKQLGPFDLILFGRQAGDWEKGQVGGMVAEHLSLPNINNVFKVDFQENRQTLFWRDINGEIQIIEGPLPMVITATNSSSNVIRMAKVKDIMQAFSKEITQIDTEELLPNAPKYDYLTIEELFKPERKNECVLIKGDTAEELANNLLKTFDELGII